VLCETPLTANAAEACEMAEPAAKSDRVVMGAFHYRYHLLTLHVEQIIGSQLADAQLFRKTRDNNRCPDVAYTYEN